jgi:hypothetical protein
MFTKASGKSAKDLYKALEKLVNISNDDACFIIIPFVCPVLSV